MDGETVHPSAYDWDDTELIQLYNETNGKAQVKVEQMMANGGIATKSSKKSSKNREKTKKWAVGDFCRAIYEADGDVYEAEILELCDDGDTCIVRFIGYDNDETVNMLDLRPSKGHRARDDQVKVATNDWDFYEFCTAPYKKSGELLEAKIIGFPDSKSCTVRFVGYEDVQVTPLSELRVSGGQVARNQQSLMASREQMEMLNEDDACSTFSSHYSSASGASSMQIPLEESPEIRARPPPVARRATSQTESHEYIPSDSAESQFRHRRSSSRQFHPPARVMSPPLVFPAMNLHDSGYEDNGSLSTLLMSWYMAGYHTGFYKGRQSRSDHTCGCSHYRRTSHH